MKKNIKLLSNMASAIILLATLLISVSYGWYTSNKEVSSSGIASTASKVISVLNQGIYKKVIGDDPFPETDKKNEVEGVLSGDVIYYSVSIGLADDLDKGVIYDLNVSVVNINGGEYFVEPAIKIVDNPNGTSTGKKYTFNQQEYDVYSDGEDDYFILVEQEKEYIYYLYEGANGNMLTKRPILIFTVPNGSLTNNKIVFEGQEYDTYLDSNGKEYFLTYDTVVIDDQTFTNATYVNYIYEQMIDGDKVRYNMCDVYTLGIFKVFGVDQNDNYVLLEDHEDDLDLLTLDKENGLDKEISFFNMFDYAGWDPSEYKEIIFTFAIKFDYTLFEGKININCVSDKELILTNVIITETEREGE